MTSLTCVSSRNHGLPLANQVRAGSRAESAILPRSLLVRRLISLRLQWLSSDSCVKPAIGSEAILSISVVLHVHILVNNRFLFGILNESPFSVVEELDLYHKPVPPVQAVASPFRNSDRSNPCRSSFHAWLVCMYISASSLRCVLLVSL